MQLIPIPKAEVPIIILLTPNFHDLRICCRVLSFNHKNSRDSHSG